MAQLVCEELTLGYDRPILTGLSFEVNAGDYPVSYTHLDVYKRQGEL